MYLNDLPSHARFFIQFGGQGNTYLRELSRLYADYPELSRYFETVFEAIDQALQQKPLAGSSILAHGLPLKDWLQDRNQPPEEYLFTCTISLTCIFITQYAYYHLLEVRGLIRPGILERTVAFTGHSQGIHSAVLASLNLQGDAFYRALKHFVQYYLFAGFRCQETYPVRQLAAEILQKAQERDFSRPTPMAAISGFTRLELMQMVADFNAPLPEEQHLDLALENTPRSLILSGREEALVGFREAYLAAFVERNAGFSYLDISAPFHSRRMSGGLDRFRPDLQQIGFLYQGHELQWPVISACDGTNMQAIENLGEYLFALQASTPLVWANCLRPLFEDASITHVLDLGPGLISTLFTREWMQGRPVEIISVATRKGLKKILEGTGAPA